MIITTFIYFLVIASLVAITSITVGLGESLVAKAALRCIDVQPSAKSEINKAALLGIAINETAAIIGLVIAIVLISETITLPNAGFALMGIACAICIPGCVTGLASAAPIARACESIARQPFFSNKIVNVMLITTSFIQTPIIFGFIISLFIFYQTPTCTNFTEGIRLLASGLCIGVGSVGPIIGLAQYAQNACTSIGYNRNAYFRIITFTFISQALIETPVIFALIVALIILNTTVAPDSIPAAANLIAAALCCAISNIAPGISSGATAAEACKQISRNPEHYSTISKISLVAQGMLDSFAVYGWAISLFILLKI